MYVLAKGRALVTDSYRVLYRATIRTQCGRREWIEKVDHVTPTAENVALLVWRIAIGWMLVVCGRVRLPALRN